MDGRRGHLLLHDKDDVMLGLKGIIELDEVHVVQLVHDADLVLHILLRRRKQSVRVVETGPDESDSPSVPFTLSFAPLILMILAASFRPVAFSSHL